MVSNNHKDNRGYHVFVEIVVLLLTFNFVWLFYTSVVLTVYEKVLRGYCVLGKLYRCMEVCGNTCGTSVISLVLKNVYNLLFYDHYVMIPCIPNSDFAAFFVGTRHIILHFRERYTLHV